MTDVFLSAPVYHHGKLEDIEAIEALVQDEDLLETMHALGLQTYSALSVDELKDSSLRAVSDVLAESSLSPADIDVIVYPSTCYFMGSDSNDPDMPTGILHHIIDALGMGHVVPYGVSFSRCVNTVNAIEFAVGMVTAQRARNVLVLAADSMQPGFSRIVDPGISVVSDVASCLLISASPRSDISFQIGEFARNVDWQLSKITAQDNFPEFLRRTIAGMEATKNKLLTMSGGEVGNYDQLITNTVNYSVVKIFSQATGFATAKIFCANVPRLGHCDGTDLVINLRSYADTSNSFGTVMAIANGPFMWGGMSLRRVQ